MADLREFALKKGINTKSDSSTLEEGSSPSKRRPWLSRENAEETKTKRRDKPVENAEETKTKRRDKVDADKPLQTKRRDKPVENVEETKTKRRDKPVENVEIDFCDSSLLVGTQRSVFNCLVNMSQQHASLSTPPLTLDALSSFTDLRSSQIHTATKELRKKGFISIDKRKNGRGGWVSYRITQAAFDSWQKLNIEQYRRENVEITKVKRSGQPGDKPGDRVSSSSSGNFSNKETTITSENIMPDDWAKIRIPDSLIELGFSPTHIRQIFLSQRGSLQADEIQSSLHDFEYDIENGHAKPYKGAVNLFLSVLRSKGLPWVSSALAASEALEIDKQLKAIELKKETFEKKKLLESSAKVDLILKDLSDDEKKKILEPDGKLKAFGSFTYEMSLKGRIHEILEESGEEYFQKQQEVSL